MHRLEESHFIADADRLFVGYRQRKSPGKIAHRLQAAFFTLFPGQDMLLRRRQQAEPFLRPAVGPPAVVEAVMEALDRREWPRTQLDIQVAKAALFTAQVLRRDLIADGRMDEVDEILQFVSSLVPESAVSPSPSLNAPPPQTDSKLGSE